MRILLAVVFAAAVSQGLLARKVIGERDAAAKQRDRLLLALRELGSGPSECLETLRICNDTYQRMTVRHKKQLVAVKKRSRRHRRVRA